jgi:hypothetical protein
VFGIGQQKLQRYNPRLKTRGAKDWRTGLGLSLRHQGKSHIIEAHHIFPKALLRKAGHETAEINEIANMAFISGETNRKLASKPADQYLAEVMERLGAEALEAHCIPIDKNLWQIDAYAQFLEVRRAALSRAVNDFIMNVGVEKRLLDVESLLKDGENDIVEFKSAARWDYEQNNINKGLEFVIAKTVAGFLNAGGGVVVLGVADDGTVVGLEKDYQTLGKRPDRDGYQQFLVTLISKTVGKVACSAIKFEFSTHNERDICIIRCSPSLKPVYVGDEARFYVRIGNTTQELNPKDAEDYLARHWRSA